MSTSLFNMFLTILLVLSALICSINCGPDKPAETKAAQCYGDLPVDIATPGYNRDYDYTEEDRIKASIYNDNSVSQYGAHEAYGHQNGYQYPSQYYEGDLVKDSVE
ncbi:uncharacterized protein LOC126836870 [Adelges cooleyi]|uniref:uncharacterized protein LOC126836870 n=1 Tax=Adelges cooleyi TaxID=133065 RepID=UPI0021801FAC|nr:uncharacterized protein LOC126836870 [Adelges cooleyi]